MVKQLHNRLHNLHVWVPGGVHEDIFNSKFIKKWDCTTGLYAQLLADHYIMPN